MKPRLHLIGIFHTQHTQSYSHCAFTGKALRFPKMMQGQGYEVIEYSNAGSEGGADEYITMLDAAEFNTLFKRSSTDFHGNDATVGSAAHQLFEQRLIPALRERLQPQDIICHPFGHAHQQLMAEFPSHQHVETGIGYPTLMPNSFRIFESYAWMHYHQGKENRNGKNYEWVVPNYYDLNDWEPSYEPGQYLAFLGRITTLKGIDTIKALADYSPWPIVLHGQGDPSPWSHPNIEYRGPIIGTARSDFLRNARALLAPTVFTEPFCGMAVEAMLCGTPVVSVNYGAMTETVTEGIMGYKCHTLQDWIDGINNAGNLDRRTIASIARNQWSLEACGRRYDKIFCQLNDLYRRGWYETKEISYNQIECEEGPFAKRLADWISCFLEPSTVLDVGCGPGTYVRALREMGVDAMGIDTDKRVAGQEHLLQQSLFDTRLQAELVLCLEVAEHIDEDKADDVVKSIVDTMETGGMLIWSAAHPGQGGTGHINCQPKAYWDFRFKEAGLERDENMEARLLDYIKAGYHMGWFFQNAMLYKKPNNH
jgi:2-polyprenyl-3-methyl-5-hydroxy-6-metoxy-1,4-benzoquinol methylase